MDRVEIFIFRDSKWEKVATLDEVLRGVPALLEALDTLRDWVQWDTRVIIDFRSRRKE